jgi:uncharacterized membrane protein YccC
LVGFGFIKSTHLPVDQWVIVTIIVVMCAQINVGSVIQKSYMRFLGTLTGSLFAVLTLSLFGKSYFVIACAIALASMLFSFIATNPKSFRDAGTLGAVTVVIILLGQNPSVRTAAERFLEISAGILIAALVSQLILPIHARTHLRRTQADTMKQLREYYIETIITEPNLEVSITAQEVDENIVKLFMAQRGLAKESVREPLGTAFNPAHFNALLKCEKEIFRSIIFMQYALDMLPNGRKNLFALPAMQHFNETICTAFEKLAKAITQQLSADIVIPSLQPIKEAVTLVSRDAASDDITHLNAVLFCAEILTKHLSELANLLAQRR